MEELAIFRIFSSFPLFGLLLPDLSSFFIYPERGISLTHIYVESFLLLSVIICTAGIWHYKKSSRGSSVPITAGS
jgi:hypothetical protein